MSVTHWESAETLYKLAWQYYLHQVKTLTRENYEYIQAEIGYPETYEQHMKRLVQGIPHDASRIVRHISQFLERYVEFTKPGYAQMIEKLIELILSDPEKHKQAALDALNAQFLTRDPDATIPEELPGHPPLFETTVGGQNFILPTYGNPLMTALYSLLFFYLVLDFEANCSSDQARDHEIIEFPAVLVETKTGKIIDEFRTFVQMITHQQLSDFIKNLTHITDEQVRKGMKWEDCLGLFEGWCRTKGLHGGNTTVVTCGDWDLKTMLPNQLQNSKSKLSPYLNNLLCCWTNIKIVYSIVYKTKATGMDGMLSSLGLTLDGHHHSGIDDCRNIVKICHEITKKGYDVTTPTNRWRPKELWYAKKLC